MEKFTEEEAERLDRVLPVELNPFLSGEGDFFKFRLGSITERWLFETHMNLPADAQEDLQHIFSNDVPASQKVSELEEFLGRRQVSSAPKWWELDFFEVRLDNLWDFFVEQCRKHYSDEELSREFDSLVHSLVELNHARHVIRVKRHGGSLFTDAGVQSALEVYDT